MGALRANPLRWTTVGAVFLAGLLLSARAVMPRAVSVVTLERQDLVRRLVLVGRVRPPSRARLGATTSGTLVDIHVREGDRVGAGDVLVLLDDREARAQVAEAEATLAEVAASVKAAVEQAEQEAVAAARDMQRLQAVAREGGITRQRVEQAEQRAADAASRLEAAQARAGVDGRGSGNATVSRAQAALEGARARLALTRITAPSDGIVLVRDAEPGDAVQPGRTLLELAVVGPTEIVVFPAEENLGGIRLNAEAAASADAFPDQTFSARVSLIAPAVDAAQGTVEVRLAVDEPPTFLLPDMTLSVNIEAGRRGNAQVLPQDAVRGLGTPEPWVAVVEDGRLVRRPVSVGLRTDTWVEVLSGVTAGEGVVPAAGSPDLGARVRIRPTGEG